MTKRTIPSYFPKPPFLPQLLIIFLLSILLTTPCLATSAPITCDPQGYASLIGTEVVATSCIPDDMNDNTALYYKYRDYSCVN